MENAQILQFSVEFCKICALSSTKKTAEAKASAGQNIRHNDRGWEIITFSYCCGAASRACLAACSYCVQAITSDLLLLN